MAGYAWIPRFKTMEDGLIYKISLHQKEFEFEFEPGFDLVCLNCVCVPSSKLVPTGARAPGSQH